MRERSKISTDYQKLCEKFGESKAFIYYPGDKVCLSLCSIVFILSSFVVIFALVFDGFHFCRNFL